MISGVFIFLIRVYQNTFGAVMGPVCRYEPSCSRYAVEALQRHGAFKGVYLATRRVCRCNPWGGRGYDPVP